MGYRFADRLMGVAKGHVAAHQIVGEIGGGRETCICRSAHVLGVCLDGGNQACECGYRIPQRVDGIEEWFFVFLIILIVGKRLALHEHK